MTREEQTKSRRAEAWRADLRKSLSPKERMALPHTVLPALSPAERKLSMTQEVRGGYTLEMAQQEAQRCLDCPAAPCTIGCPAHVAIPTFIKNIERGSFQEALHVIHESSCLPAICSRVCAQEKQCEGHCTYVKLGKKPVGIGGLERFVTDYVRKHSLSQESLSPCTTSTRIAVVGAGPAGLAFADEMAKAGYSVTIFEKEAAAGGVLRYGIPEYRLPKAILDQEIAVWKEKGIDFRFHTTIGRDVSLEQLKDEGYAYIFIGNGVGESRMMGIPGETLKGIYSANEFLFKVNTGQLTKDYFLHQRVAVVGGGNTAMDTSRTALRLGAKEVVVIYRRSEVEMPAGVVEVTEAKEEGIKFLNLHNPLQYEGNEEGKVGRVLLQQMELSTPDESGRRSFVPIAGATQWIEVDAVIVSIGSTTDGILQQDPAAPSYTRWGTIAVDEATQCSSVPHIYAGGDTVRGGSTVVLAMRDGREAARELLRHLTPTAS